MEGFFDIAKAVLDKEPSLLTVLRELELDVELNSPDGNPNITPSMMNYAVIEEKPFLSVIPIPTGNVDGVVSYRLGNDMAGERDFHRHYAQIHHWGIDWKFHYYKVEYFD